MVEWSTVISLVLFGLALIIVEIIFIPGTTLVGLVGFAFMIVGVGLSFRYFGSETGWTVVGATGVVSGGVLYLAFKSNIWGRFALKSSMSGHVNEGELDHLLVGQEGLALSALRPVGKASFGEASFEVRTMGEYVDSGIKVKIIKLLQNQIVVEPIN